MKNFWYWVMAAISFTFVLIMVCAAFMPADPPTRVPWDEVEKDGWKFVGRTPIGMPIYKKYFADHGVWIFTACGRHESISAVPVEVLQRTQNGESYK